MINHIKTITIAAIAGAVTMIGSSQSAMAATCDPGAVTITTIDGTLQATPIDAAACAGKIDGNLDQNAVVPAITDGVFDAYDTTIATLDWIFLDKSDNTSPVVTADNGAVEGDWAADFSPYEVEYVIVNLKAGNGYSMFLFEIDPAASSFAGTFSTTLAGLVSPNENGQTLSHLDVAGVYIAMSPVPLPAAGFLLLGGLGGLAMVRRRKRG